MTILNNSSSYNELVKYFEKNKEKPIEDWLEFKGLVGKMGKQGIVGLLESKDKTIKGKYIFKFSQYINYLAFHELIIMQGLGVIANYCPHFCQGIGMFHTKIDARYRQNKNPFEITHKHPVEKDILLCEYIEDSYKFYNYIRSEKVPEDVLFSIVKQVLLAISIAQKEKQFSHYDLHSNNIMIKTCNKDLVFLYKIDNENQFVVPTLGCYPVIIDYGFSYISDMKDGPAWASLGHTDVGFMSDRFDWVADPKLFLVTVSDEIRDKKRTKKSKLFRRIVKNIFYPLTIDWQSGWDITKEKRGATDFVIEFLEPLNKKSDLFQKFDHYCIDILQTLIILPLQEQDYKDIEISYTTFLNEWIKIENEISDPFYNMYILKGIVDTVREIRPDYMDKKTRTEAIKSFRLAIYDIIASVSKFCLPKNVHYEKMLCSLLVFTKCLEGQLYKIMKIRMMEKQEEYDQLPLQSIDQIYGAITTNIPDEYIYNEKTEVLVIDNVRKTCETFKLPKNEIADINNISNLAKGCYLNDIYENIKSRA